jgi:hypothetical protein
MATHLDRGGRSYASTPTLFIPVSADLIARLEAIVDAGIELLDAIGGDPDLEPSLLGNPLLPYDAEGDEAEILEGDGQCDEEPSLAAPETAFYRADQRGWCRGGEDDREEENEHGGDVLDEPHDDLRHDDEDDGCGEPDLGAPAGGSLDQRQWAQGRDHYGADAYEASLGWTPAESATESYVDADGREHDAGDDREWDPADDGIGDADGLDEQLGRAA